MRKLSEMYDKVAEDFRRYEAEDRVEDRPHLAARMKGTAWAFETAAEWAREQGQ